MFHIATLKNTLTGLYLYWPNFSSPDPGTMLNYPCAWLESAPAPASITASGQPVCFFGDLKEGYCVVDGAALTMIRDPYSQKGFVLFYASAFVGGGVVKGEAINALYTCA
jgi:HK97 family phage major capsid protein